jgi:hypothetical protein
MFADRSKNFPHANSLESTNESSILKVGIYKQQLADFPAQRLKISGVQCSPTYNFRLGDKLLRTEQNVDPYNICVLHARLEFIDPFAPRPFFGNRGGSFLFFESSSGLIRFNPVSRIQILEVNWDA